VKKMTSSFEGRQTLDAETEHVPFSTRKLSVIKPSPENDKLYKPVNARDPSIRELATSIREKGLLEPLVITRDNFLISGHRRLVACKLAGLTEVPVRVEDVFHGDPNYVVLLREHNRQRVKSLDELARETVVDMNPDQAHEELLAHRQQVSRQAILGVDAIELEERKARSAISAARQPFLDAIKCIVEDLKEFWPLTDRQVHYQLLNNPPLVHASKPHSTYVNNPECYKATCDLLTRARLVGAIDFWCIDDATRPISVWANWRESGSYLTKQLNRFLTDYRRDLMQSQPNHIEIVGEKNTIAGIIEPVAAEFGIPMTLGRGYCSLAPRGHMLSRFRRSGKDLLVLLIVSDFDPEGESIAESFARSMRDDFGVRHIRAVKVALTFQQVRQLNLPPNFKAKAKSSRYRKFVAKYGKNVFELEALRPEQLQQMLRDAIESVIDAHAYNAEIAAEKKDAAHLAGMRKAVQTALADSLNS
jgi:hypothetical protein